MRIAAIIFLIMFGQFPFAQIVNTPWADDDRIGIGTDAPEEILDVNGVLQLRRLNADYANSSKLSFQATSNNEPRPWFIQNIIEGEEVPKLTFFEDINKPKLMLRSEGGWVFYDSEANPELYAGTAQDGGGIYIPNYLSVGELEVNSLNAQSMSSGFISTLYLYSSSSNISLMNPFVKYTAKGSNTETSTSHRFTVTTPLTQSTANIASFANGGAELVKIDKSGNLFSSGTISSTGDISTNSKMKIGIGAENIGTHSLAVNGSAIFTKALVKLTTNWPDYVFEETYELPTLTYIEDFIKRNKHLPGVPSATEVESNGIDLGDTQVILLKKIEELTLYIIELNKRIELLEKQK